MRELEERISREVGLSEAYFLKLKGVMRDAGLVVVKRTAVDVPRCPFRGDGSSELKMEDECPVCSMAGDFRSWNWCVE